MKNNAALALVEKTKPKARLIKKGELKVVAKKPVVNQTATQRAEEEVWDDMEILDLLRAWQADFLTRKECAEALGISPSWLGQMINHDRLPGPKPLRAMGIVRKWRYRRG